MIIVTKGETPLNKAPDYLGKTLAHEKTMLFKGWRALKITLLSCVEKPPAKYPIKYYTILTRKRF